MRTALRQSAEPPSTHTEENTMPEADTALEVRRAGDHAAIIAIRGELTGATDADLMEAYGRAAGPPTRVVVLDFSELEYMNSTGIGLLVTMLVRAQRQR